MLASLIGLLAPTVGEKWAKPAAWALILVAAAALFFGGKALYDRSVVDHHDAKIERRAKPATDQAAAERADDAITNAKKQEEMNNVIAAQPDQPISPTSRALACERLRRAGRHIAACS